MTESAIKWTCKLADLKDRIGNIDVFVCCASFETRCLSIAKQLDLSKSRRSLVGCFDQRPGKTTQHLNELLNFCGNSGQELLLHSTDPIRSADAVFDGLRSVSELRPTTVVVDVSTFTHEIVLVLHRLLPMFRDGATRVIYLYTGAKEYSLGDDQSQKWLSRGLREVRSVIGYPGELLPSQSIHLILLAGFELERAIGLIREFEPSHVSLGCGDRTSEFTKPHQSTNERTIESIQRAQSIASHVERFEFDPYSPVDTHSAVEAQWQRHQDMNTVISPLNTKLSTLGVARFARATEAVQVCYAQPLFYNFEQYSEPRDDVWGFEDVSNAPLNP